MPVAALKPTVALSATKGVKRGAPTGEEPTPKRARVDTVTRVFAADNSQGHSGRSRKGARNRNSTMRDLLTQSRNAVIMRHSSGSAALKGSYARSVPRVGSLSSKTLASHSSRTSPTFSDIITEMEIDHGGLPAGIRLGPSASRTLDAVQPLPSADQRLTLTHKLGSTGASTAELSREEGTRSFTAATSGALRLSKGPPRVPFSKPSFHIPRPTSSNHPPLHFDSHAAAFNSNQPESTLAEIHSEAARAIPLIPKPAQSISVAVPTASAPRRYGKPDGNWPPEAGVSFECGIPVTSRNVGNKVSEVLLALMHANANDDDHMIQQLNNNEDSGMPKWLVQTLSRLPSRYPLAIAPAVASPAFNNDSANTSEESPLSLFHASTSSLEYSNRKAAHSHSRPHQEKHLLATAEASTAPGPPRKEEDPPFAFVPPPISPHQDSKIAVPRPELGDHDFATSTPPWRAKPHGPVHFRQGIQVEDSDNCPSEHTAFSLFDASIAPILQSGQANATDSPNTPYSYFTGSPPDTAFTLASNAAAESQPSIFSHSNVEDAVSDDQTRYATLLAPPPSVDLFGATWAALQSSESDAALPIIRPFSQRRFFFTNAHLNKHDNQPASYLSHNSTPFDSVSSPRLLSEPSRTTPHISQQMWSPSFPEAKVPNHRRALPPLKSQLRNNFLGAENPLVTPAAIEAATAAADQNPACHDISDVLNAGDASMHVRFRIPIRSPSLSSSKRGGSRHLDRFEETQLSQCDHSSDRAGDEDTLADEMCFFYDEPSLAEHMLLANDKNRTQVERSLSLGAAVDRSVGLPLRQDSTSVNGRDFESHIGQAGIGTEDELLRLLEADAGEEVNNMQDIEKSTHGTGDGYQEAQCTSQIDRVHTNNSDDSICSWGDHHA